MRVNTANGTAIIDEDQDVVQMAASLDVNAKYWDYAVKDSHGDPVLNEDGTPKIERVDVRGCRTNTEVLMNAYLRAQSSKNPYDAAAYCQLKARVLALYEANLRGDRYEPEFIYTEGAGA